MPKLRLLLMLMLIPIVLLLFAALTKLVYLEPTVARAAAQVVVLFWKPVRAKCNLQCPGSQSGRPVFCSVGESCWCWCVGAFQ